MHARAAEARAVDLDEVIVGAALAVDRLGARHADAGARSARVLGAERRRRADAVGAAGGAGLRAEAAAAPGVRVADAAVEAAVAVGRALGADPALGEVDAHAARRALGLALHVHGELRGAASAGVELEQIGGRHADAAVRDEAAAEGAAVRRTVVVDGAVDPVVARPAEEGQPGEDGELLAGRGVLPPDLAGLRGGRRHLEVALAGAERRVRERAPEGRGRGVLVDGAGADREHAIVGAGGVPEVQREAVERDDDLRADQRGQARHLFAGRRRAPASVGLALLVDDLTEREVFARDRVLDRGVLVAADRAAGEREREAEEGDYRARRRSVAEGRGGHAGDLCNRRTRPRRPAIEGISWVAGWLLEEPSVAGAAGAAGCAGTAFTGAAGAAGAAGACFSAAISVGRSNAFASTGSQLTESTVISCVCPITLVVDLVGTFTSPKSL